ncbi:MAG: oligosaccharide flippase family protein [Candidatus Uhrbacteria bacterium]
MGKYSLHSFSAQISKILRHLEKYTRTDNIYLAKNTSLVILVQAVNVFNGVVIYILIAHFLSKETYGQYKYFLSLFSLFSLTTFSGIELAVARDVANGNDGGISVGFRRKLIGGILGSIISIIGAGYYAFQGRNDLTIALILLSIFAPWIYASNVYSSLFTGKKLFAEYTKINIASSIFSSLGMAAAFIFIKDPVLLFAAFLGTSSVLLVSYYIAKRKCENNKVGKDMLSFGTHMSIIDILGTIANSIDSILVFHFLGAPALAIYSFATIPVEQLKGFMKSVQSIALPKFAVNQISETRKTIGPKIFLFAAGVTGTIIVYIILIPFFFKLFFPAYSSSVPYSQIYSLSLIFGMPGSLISTIFQAKGLKKETAQFNTINYTIQIVLLLLGAWLYGLWGVIIARIGARTLMYFTAHTILQRSKDQPLQVE